MKKLCICLGMLFVLSTSLCVHFAMRKPICEQPHLSDDLRLWGEVDAVPNEETAIKIATAIIEAQSDYEFSGYNDKNYSVEVTYNEEKNEWFIYYNPGNIVGGDIEVYLRRDNGMVTDLWYGK